MFLEKVIFCTLFHLFIIFLFLFFRIKLKFRQETIRLKLLVEKNGKVAQAQYINDFVGLNYVAVFLSMVWVLMGKKGFHFKRERCCNTLGKHHLGMF